MKRQTQMQTDSRFVAQVHKTGKGQINEGSPNRRSYPEGLGREIPTPGPGRSSGRQAGRKAMAWSNKGSVHTWQQRSCKHRIDTLLSLYDKLVGFEKTLTNYVILAIGASDQTRQQSCRGPLSFPSRLLLLSFLPGNLPYCVWNFTHRFSPVTNFLSWFFELIVLMATLRQSSKV